MCEGSFYRKSWMTEAQWACWQFAADLMGGFHHIHGKPKPCGDGIEFNDLGSGWSTFDADRLTRAVIMAHDRCMRVQISPCNMQYLCISVHKRKGRDGRMHERHPTIEDALGPYRAKPTGGG